jgi:hypothetical protein
MNFRPLSKLINMPKHMILVISTIDDSHENEEINAPDTPPSPYSPLSLGEEIYGENN